MIRKLFLLAVLGFATLNLTASTATGLSDSVTERIKTRSVQVETDLNEGLGVALGNGWFLTAYHVVKSDKKDIKVNGFDATLVHRGSDRNDWALLYADNYVPYYEWIPMRAATQNNTYYMDTKDGIQEIYVKNKYDKFKFGFDGYTPYAGLSGSGVYNSSGDLVGILTHVIKHEKSCNGNSCTMKEYITGLIVPLQKEMFEKSPVDNL